MTTTDLALIAAIALLVLGCAAYVVLRVRRVSRAARDREQRRAAALLAEVTASVRPTAGDPARLPVSPVSPGAPAFTSYASSAPTTTPTTTPAADNLVAAARELAADLRRTADRVVAIAEDPMASVPARSDAVVAAVGEATSAYALRRVVDAARR